MKLLIYQKQQLVIARAVNSLHDPQKPNIIVLYGDSNFVSGGRGHNWSGESCIALGGYKAFIQ